MTLTLDGHANGIFSSPATSGTVTLTTTQTNDIIVVVVYSEHNTTSPARTVSSVSSTHIASGSWTRRGGYTTTNTPSGYLYGDVEIWWAVSSSALTSEIITVQLSGAPDDAAVVAFGVNGANTTTPFDTNASLPKTASASAAATSTPSVTISTSNANDFIFVAYCNSQADTVSTWPSGYAIVDSGQNTGGSANAYNSVGYRIVSSTQSSVALQATMSGTDPEMVIADAIVQASSGQSTAGTTGIQTSAVAAGGSQTYGASSGIGSSGTILRPSYYDETGKVIFEPSGYIESSGRVAFAVTNAGRAYEETGRLVLGLPAATSQLASGSLSIQSSATELTSSLYSATVTINSSATELASSNYSASVGIQVSASVIASSIRAASASIQASETQIGSSTYGGSVGIQSVATETNTTSYSSAATSIASSATEISGTVGSGSTTIQSSATELSGSLATGSVSIQSSALELASSLCSGSTSVSAAATVIASSISSGSVGIQSIASESTSSTVSGSVGIQSQGAANEVLASVGIRTSSTVVTSSLVASVVGISSTGLEIPTSPSSGLTTVSSIATVVASSVYGASSTIQIVATDLFSDSLAASVSVSSSASVVSSSLVSGSSGIQSSETNISGGVTTGSTSIQTSATEVASVAVSGSAGLKSTGAPLRWASVGGQQPLHYIAITLTNNQSTPTAVNFPQQVIVNSNSNSGIYQSSLVNVNYQDGNGNILNSWLESGESNTNTASTYWVNLASNTIAANGGTLVIYQVIYPTSTHAIDGTDTGAEPKYTGTYGQYDNGSSVFTFYDNFIGSSLSATKWGGPTGSIPPSISVSNGLTVSGSGAVNGGIYTKSTYAEPLYVDALIASDSISGGSPSAGIGESLSQSYGSNSFDNSYGLSIGGTTTLTMYVFNASGGQTSISTTSFTESFPLILNLAWAGTGIQNSSTNYTTNVLSGSNSSVSIANYYITVYNSGGSFHHTTTYQWIRARIYPPSNVMPSTSFGSAIPTFLIIAAGTSSVQSSATVVLSEVASGTVGISTSFGIPLSGSATIGTYAVVYTPNLVSSVLGSATLPVVVVAGSHSNSYPSNNTYTSSGVYVPPSTSINPVLASQSVTITYVFDYYLVNWYKGGNVVTTVTDIASTPLPGMLVNYTANNCTISSADGVTNSSGQVTISVSSVGAGAYVTTTTSILGLIKTSTVNVTTTEAISVSNVIKTAATVVGG